MVRAPIALIGAMEEEIAKLLEKLKQTEVKRYAGTDFYQGQLNDTEVVVCRSGVGKVNAAICTQILVDRFQVGAVLFTGVAGALDPSLQIGDIVISRDCMQHDMDASALGFKVGEIPFMNKSAFKSDPQLIEWAEQAGKEIEGPRIMIGRVLSGDQFIADRSEVARLREEFSGVCTEMEGAAVAQVCTLNEVPFVIVRSMSDRADGSAPENFAEFTKLAAERSIRIIEGIVHRIRN